MLLAIALRIGKDLFGHGSALAMTESGALIFSNKIRNILGVGMVLGIGSWMRFLESDRSSNRIEFPEE